MKATYLFAACCLLAGLAPATEPDHPFMVLAAGDEVEPDPPIIQAAEQGKLAQVRRLLDKGADIHTRNYCGWTPLHVAAQEGRTAIVRFLLEKGAGVDMVDDYGRTPLQYAVHANLDIVKLLVESGADVNSKDQDGETPLGSAYMEGGCESEADAGGSDRAAIIQYLQSKGAR